MVAEQLHDLEQRIELLAKWIYEAQCLVFFTGAGISTESGLPDFRGSDGRVPPVVGAGGVISV